ncbi:hypothetical protein BZA05DRAFT_165765 [Tricharina praecox]|uniref:uncharacterized protein n=1 Tax=Tricharina praecox TaxID=43433 RepID=UPI00221F50D6|nr:uncharacterized protein BZA05DRAFT_165765 [Tricharina praecox]KAI5857085.1 hypothetical protein BZA05DRAFT_165765 [Tricharina praecox]
MPSHRKRLMIQQQAASKHRGAPSPRPSPRSRRVSESQSQFLLPPKLPAIYTSRTRVFSRACEPYTGITVKSLIPSASVKLCITEIWGGRPHTHTHTLHAPLCTGPKREHTTTDRAGVWEVVTRGPRLRVRTRGRLSIPLQLTSQPTSQLTKSSKQQARVHRKYVTYQPTNQIKPSRKRRRRRRGKTIAVKITSPNRCSQEKRF